MAEVAENSTTVDGAERVYTTNWAHISDELRRLDLLIHLQLLKHQRSVSVNGLEQYRGLVLSDQEVAGLLENCWPLPEKPEREISGPDDPRTQFLCQALNQLASQIERRRNASLNEDVYLALPHLTRLFNLTTFEEQSLVVCLAPELDGKYEKLYAYIQDDVTRRKPSIDLALKLLCSAPQEKMAARRAFGVQGPLLKYRLLQVSNDSADGPVPLLSRSLTLDDGIVDFLLDQRRIDRRLEPIAHLIFPQARDTRDWAVETLHGRMWDFICSHFSDRRTTIQNLVFYLYGPYGAGKRCLAESVCHKLGLPLLVADAVKMLAAHLPFSETAWLLGREAALQSAALCVENLDSLLLEEDKHQSQLKWLAETVRTFSRLAFLLGGRAWKPCQFFREQAFIDVEICVPNDRSRRLLWEQYCRPRHRFAEDIDLGSLASKFRFTPGQIQDAVRAAQQQACWRSPADTRVSMGDFYAACRAQSNQKLRLLARKIEPRNTWDDIVLPADQLAQLREICNQGKYRHIVYGDWGFDRKLSLGKGLIVLFSGPSGTGKTMAAEIIANELHLDLYQIDLSQVVSKYIGETEKNLSRIFDEAQTSNAILFFDEADALFGKRSEVKDAHDRYANIDIAYLLQKMEEYEGISVLASNLRRNMDDGFLRRITFTAHFPFPDEESRRRIWQTIWPPEAPLGEDLDVAFLARQFKLTGGSIKNVAMAATFLAADNGGPVTMAHLLQAMRREFQKMGKPISEAEFDVYRDQLQELGAKTDGNSKDINGPGTVH